MKRLAVFALAMACTGSSALADSIQPVTLEVREKEPGRFVVRWKVPGQLPASAIPAPVLPESFTPYGERDRKQRPGAWFLEQIYTSSEGLEGELLGIDYPFVNVNVSTLLRVELLSGARHAHVLAPGEESWQVPESVAGRAPRLYRESRKSLLQGVVHFLSNPVHFVFLLALVFLGILSNALRLASIFTAGQLVALLAHPTAGLTLAPAYGEIGLAVAAALLAREAMRPVQQRRQLAGLAAVAGLSHGLAVAGEGILHGVLIVAGFDAALVFGLILVLGLAHRRMTVSGSAPPRLAATRRGAYLVGAVALVLACAFPLPASSRVAKASGLRLPQLQIPASSGGTSASQRLAARVPGAPLQSFVAIGAFEVRHEVLLRLRDLGPLVGLEPGGVLAVERQAEIQARLVELVTRRTQVSIDGTPAKPAQRRADFLTLDPATGALPRSTAVPEPIDSAWVGVTSVYLTDTTPRESVLTWTDFDLAEAIPATVTDPEATQTVQLTAEQPVLRWVNSLAEDPAPVVRATAIEPTTRWIPWVSIVLLAGAALLALARGRSRMLRVAFARVAFAASVVLAPFPQVAWTFPTDAVPGPAQARAILAGVLPNLYRAFELPSESIVYDRLALTVTGPTLTDIYLQQRRAIEMGERGGAKARVEAVEVSKVSSVEPADGEGFVAHANWTVGGTVVHFGHRHFRQNGYEARISLVPVEGHWKIQAIEVLGEERLQ